MVAARIQINATTGSNPPNGSALEPGDVITLNNLGNGGESTYLWEFLDIPPDSLAAFSNANVQSPTFTADCEGTYLIKVTVNRLLASEKTDTAIVGVAQVRNPTMRVPAAYETTQYNVEGWSQAVNTNLRLLDSALSDSNRRVGVADGSTLLRGQIVAQTGNATILAGLPGETIVATYELAPATDATLANGPLFVVEGAADGTTAAAAGALVVVRALGLFGPMTPVGLTVPGDVYLSDTGTFDNLPGTVPRRLGKAIVSIDANEWVQFDGVSGAAGAAMVVEPFVFQSTPAGTYAGALVLTNLTTPVDLITTANINNLRLTRFSSTQTAGMLLLRDEFGSDIFRIDKRGNVNIYGIDADTRKTIGSNISLRVEAGGALTLVAADDLSLQAGGITGWTIDAATGSLVAVDPRFISNLLDPADPQDAATRAFVAARTHRAYTWGNTSTQLTQGILDPGFVDRLSPAVTDPRPITKSDRTGTIRNLTVTVYDPPVGANQEFEVLINGTPTGIIITALATDPAETSYGDFVNTASVATGDTIAIRTKNTGTLTTGAMNVVAEFEIERS